jgi:UDPglucose 6-dehydrogenase
MKVVIAGAGYVGLVTGACLAETGATVACVDVDEVRIASLQIGELPFYEPQLGELVETMTRAGRLVFSTYISADLVGAEVVLICVGTPPQIDGSVDLSDVFGVAHEIGRNVTNPVVVVTKSTVPVGTSEKVRAIIALELAKRGVSIEFDVASNPEFLREGCAVNDFTKPDRIVLGVDSKRAREVLGRLYRPFVLHGYPIQFMDVASAELTKYAANAMLAMRISFMNVMAQVCESVGADISEVRDGLAADPRIGPDFLNAGIGYGGSCFSKDVRALVHTGGELGVNMALLRSAEEVNERQKISSVDRVEAELGTLQGRRIAIWGLSFKPNTDDVRGAPSLAIIRALKDRGADVVAFDPIANDAARRELGNMCTYLTDKYEVLDGADALILVTEWSEFLNIDGAEISRRMRGQLIFDGRNVLDGAQLALHGLRYRSVGRRP